VAYYWLLGFFIGGKEDRMQNKELKYFQSFRDVCKVINSSLNLKVVLMLITENIVKLLNVKACTIFLLDILPNLSRILRLLPRSKSFWKPPMRKPGDKFWEVEVFFMALKMLRSHQEK
jgi:hypothetical protein